MRLLPLLENFCLGNNDSNGSTLNEHMYEDEQNQMSQEKEKKHNILLGLGEEESKCESENSSEEEEDSLIQQPIYQGDDGRRRKCRQN